jgi:hypothetical protein
MSDSSRDMPRDGRISLVPTFDNGRSRLTFCPSGAAGFGFAPPSTRRFMKLTEEL